MESPMHLPEVIAVEQESQQMGLSVTAPELHGSLSGLLAGGGCNGPDWLAMVLADAGVAAPPKGSVLERLYQATASQLEDPDFAFQLLLADDGATLAARAHALFEWCRAFLGGFGLAAHCRSVLSAEGDEILRDLAKLAQASVDDFDMNEEKEDGSLEEIEEFVRVAVLLLHGDCLIGPCAPQRLN
ncbi:YecA family protein [Xylella fastidiosa]|uniref:YecA/YgfB family protein n=1 Tax=Xylella fastidiosa TaxID=2371 RepID=UPI00049A5987|nr:YecA family protein [Xylella fastidiosa]AIC12357.1 hypothetical protein P303_04145 [Xylella fastidiosa MUL0034]UIN27651.1 YecA family protein [Xylella fastidiosa subsp. morus]UIT42497.1 YecA family protein [Xylella fastidiosa subsp. morus]